MNFGTLVGYVQALSRRDEGQDLIEYAFLVGLISLVAVAAITAAGTSVNGIWTGVSTALAAVPGA
jgi:Flp pilus assembly pilin Flp